MMIAREFMRQPMRMFSQRFIRHADLVSALAAYHECLTGLHGLLVARRFGVAQMPLPPHSFHTAHFACICHQFLMGSVTLCLSASQSGHMHNTYIMVQNRETFAGLP